jgi:hypothetical protein
MMKIPGISVFSHSVKPLPSPYTPPSDVYVPPPSFPSIVQSEPLPPVLPWAPPPPGYEYNYSSPSKGVINWTEIALIAGTGLIVFLAMK